MIKEKKLSLTLGILAGIITICLVGSTAGTLAWYAYSRSVSMSFVGTTVSNSELLNVGLVDNNNVFTQEDLQTYDLQRESATDGSVTNSIVWSKSRSGFSLLALRHYLEESNYAVDALKPVTTGSMAYDDSNPLTLYRSPEYGDTDFESIAETKDYVYLPLAFRVLDEHSEYIAGKDVWLTDAVVDAEEEAESSVRVHVDGTNKFLMQPSDTNNDVGETKVGGVLSIGPGEYYDFNGNKELCYGEFETPKDEIVYNTLPASQYNVLDNMNDVADPTIQTTFNAKHYPNVLVPDIDAAVPKVQEHAGFGKVKPSVNTSGQWYADDVNGNGIAVSITSNESKVGYATLTIFIEGWDHAVIDQKAGYSFNLGLRFEINK